MDSRDNWGHWFRDNFTFLVLCAFVLFMLFYNVYVLHNIKSDETYITFARETTNIFLGALIGIITGSRMGSKPPTSDTRVSVRDADHVNVNQPPANPANQDNQTN